MLKPDDETMAYISVEVDKKLAELKEKGMALLKSAIEGGNYPPDSKKEDWNWGEEIIDWLVELNLV